ncbi:DNA polymerase zeta catalytic subunit-like isoform X2 [Oscarella lobularis]|uniref:DNA polymerase zeta catalytic subunit-like isoform X2 n=1 Tax=Oscarella lobularis TaxID=121494 RepID=UPI003313391D
MNPFRVRIVTADFYMAQPVAGLDVGYSDFRCSLTKQIPVIRVYGSTPGGQKACVHVHGLFPYIYVPCNGGAWQTDVAYMRQIAASIDVALHVALGRGDRVQQQAVYKIVPVRGLPFYGYHAEEKLFLKIYLYNPFTAGRVAELLQTGAVMNHCFQPHESHIPFLLQFFMDYNLYGMNFIEFSAVKFRLPLTPATLSSSPVEIWNETTISRDLLLSPSVTRQSVCELEADGVAVDILNQKNISQAKFANPGLAAIWEDEQERRRQQNESSQLTPPLSPDRADRDDYEPERAWKEEIRRIIEQHTQSDTEEAQEASSDQTISDAASVEIHQSQISPVQEEQEPLGRISEDVVYSSSSQPAYDQRIDSDVVNLLANLDESSDSTLASSLESNHRLDSSQRGESARLLSQHLTGPTLSGEPSKSVNELLSYGLDVDDEQDLMDLANTMKEDEEESFQLSQRLSPSYNLDSSMNSSFDSAAAALMDEFDAANTTIPQLDGSRDRPGSGERKIYPLRKSSSLSSSSRGSRGRTGDFQSSFSRSRRAASDRRKAETTDETTVAALSSGVRFLVPVAEKIPFNVSRKYIRRKEENESVETIQSGTGVDAKGNEKGIMRFPGKERSSFYVRSSFRFGFDEHPLFRAGDDALLDVFSSFDGRDSDDALQRMGFRSPSPPPLSSTTESSSFALPTLERAEAEETDRRLPASFIVLRPLLDPPTKRSLVESAGDYGIPQVSHRTAYYSVASDATRSRDVRDQRFHVPSEKACNLPKFDTRKCLLVDTETRRNLTLNQIRKEYAVAGVANQRQPTACIMTPARTPVHPSKTREWLNQKQKNRQRPEKRPAAQSTPINSQSKKTRLHSSPSLIHQSVRQTARLKLNEHFCYQSPESKHSDGSFIEGPTLNNSFGFRVSQKNLQDAKALKECQHLTQFSLELHVRTRGTYRPDPTIDSICAAFYCIWRDVPMGTPAEITGVYAVSGESDRQRGEDLKFEVLDRCGLSGIKIDYFPDEKSLLREFIDLVRRHDPDILVGYEIQMLSWGYAMERAAALDVNFCTEISRVPDRTGSSRHSTERDEYGARHMSEICVCGRIVLNVWRLMRKEVTLTGYSFENVVFHVLHQRIPSFDFKTLTSWFDQKTNSYRWRVVENYLRRCRFNLLLLERLDIVGRTSELARLFGILFYSVISRGSQYRVESMMLRIAKPMNYVPVSPSPRQRAKMNAPECLQLIMEPESRFYTDPVVVLDFRSLYPSIIIAHNYCFSTCLGRVSSLSEAGDFKFGATSLNVPPQLLKKLEPNISVSPNGVAFVKPCVRKGVLPKMLEEILKTRIMVKQSMKKCKDKKSIYRMLDARQLGLKLIANVTYGYTSANFSGRMPCVEIGDSIVRKARETLEKAIDMVERNPRWKAKVVYGDTDSMFLLLKGVSKDRAFEIGHEIVEAVTAANPKPVKLKFEKVYLPCVLETKKRYVGFMYETPEQKEPVFDAKGIETVRRDGCQAAVKILERSIKLLFESRDVSQVKRYVQKQCTKILEDRVPMLDFIIAKEYRGMGTYKPGACVPCLEITKKLLATDPRAEPRVGERVPYVIVYGSPGLPLIQLVRRPDEVLYDSNLRLNSIYYVTKQILPPLTRIFSLLGVDVFSWYNELPRFQKSNSLVGNDDESRKETISHYFRSVHCVVCNELCHTGVCSSCRERPQLAITVLESQLRTIEKKYSDTREVCFHCLGFRDPGMLCTSLECPNLYRLVRDSRDLAKRSKLDSLEREIF